MSLPFFYIDDYDGSGSITLNEETSKHIIQVLRMKAGEMIRLTDGNGQLLECGITGDHRKYCTVTVKKNTYQEPRGKKISIAISLLKNASRFEWFLEKVTELGVSEIIPLLCSRTEKEKFRFDRMQGICISAMLQSQQCWLPTLREPTPFENWDSWKLANANNYIAHCMDDAKQPLNSLPTGTFSNFQIAIGPEGDFTKEEVALALQNGFTAVSLGDTRLRTETAGVAAAVMLTL